MNQTKNLITIDPKEYGLSQDQADRIIEVFRDPFAEMAELETKYKDFENLTGDPTNETCAAAKMLKQKYVKIRTSTADLHKTEKAFFLKAGRCIDAFKNRQLEIGKEREKRLTEISDFYIIKEQKRIEKLTEARTAELEPYQDPDEYFIPGDLGQMPDAAYQIYLSGFKAAHETRQEEKERETRKQARHMEMINTGFRVDNETGFYFVHSLSVLTSEIPDMPDADYFNLLEAAREEIAAFDAEQEQIRKDNEALQKKNAALTKKVEAVKVEKKQEKKSLSTGPDINRLKMYIQMLVEVAPPKIEDAEVLRIYETLDNSIGAIINAAERSLTRLEK